MLLNCRWSRLEKVKDTFLLDWIGGSLGCDAMLLGRSPTFRCRLLLCGFLRGLLFDFEDGSNMFLRNFGLFSELRGVGTQKTALLTLFMARKRTSR
jgi:hypothetical protein